MNTWQVARQIQYLVRAAVWTGSSTKVFHTESVKVTAAIPQANFERVILPALFISPGGNTSDPSSQEDPNLLEQELAMKLAVGHAGDAFGEFAMVGGQRTGQTDSRGRGLLEVEEEVFNAIEFLNTDDGVVIQHRMSSAPRPEMVGEQYVLMRDYLFKLDTTADRFYHPVINLTSTDDVRNTPTPTPTVTPTPTP